MDSRDTVSKKKGGRGGEGEGVYKLHDHIGRLDHYALSGSGDIGRTWAHVWGAIGVSAMRVVW